MGQPQQNRCEGDEVLRDILGALSYGPLGLSGASGAHTTLPKEQCPQAQRSPMCLIMGPLGERTSKQP